MLSPGATIGIVGGGQLGRMLAMAAARLGFRIIVLDPSAEAPAFQVANATIIAVYDDPIALSELAQKADVITYEFENVPVDTLNSLPSSTEIHPNTRALSTSQDRLSEKRFFQSLGIEVAPFFDCPTEDDLTSALVQTGGQGILKTRRFGYDGKGQIRISKDRDGSLDEAMSLIEKTPSILEGFVSFKREISVIAARSHDGEIVCYDPAENVHRNGILHSSSVPANVSSETESAAKSIAEKVLEALDYVGVVGIEFFMMDDGELIVNEFAPRVHNSGHWTEAACAVSQFEQHIRAVAGLPLGSARRHSNCRMENLIGSEIDAVPDILKKSNTLLHLYGKNEVRDGRKMGHFTEIFPSE